MPQPTGNIEAGRRALNRWAMWISAGANTTSSLGFPPRTAEMGAGEGRSSNKPTSRTPTWFAGCDEQETHRKVWELPEKARVAVFLNYLWTSKPTSDGVGRVTAIERQNRWSELTGLDPRGFQRYLSLGERMVDAMMRG